MMGDELKINLSFPVTKGESSGAIAGVAPKSSVNLSSGVESRHATGERPEREAGTEAMEASNPRQVQTVIEDEVEIPKPNQGSKTSALPTQNPLFTASLQVDSSGGEDILQPCQKPSARLTDVSNAVRAESLSQSKSSVNTINQQDTHITKERAELVSPTKGEELNVARLGVKCQNAQSILMASGQIRDAQLSKENLPSLGFVPHADKNTGQVKSTPIMQITESDTSSLGCVTYATQKNTGSGGEQSSSARKEGDVKCDALAEHSVTMHTETIAESTGVIPIGSAASNVQPADAACPKDVIAPTLSGDNEKQPSLRPSPTSGVTPPIHTRWKKGQSGNPGGRAKHVSRAYIKHLEEVDPETGLTNAELIAKNQIKLATIPSFHSTATAREIRQATETDDESKSGFNIGTLNMAILNQITGMATKKELE